MVITNSVTYYTISDEQYTAIRKRMAALRRSKPETLNAIVQSYPGQENVVPASKTNAITTIIIQEFGVNTQLAYLHRQAQARKPRRRNGQYKLTL